MAEKFEIVIHVVSPDWGPLPTGMVTENGTIEIWTAKRKGLKTRRLIRELGEMRQRLVNGDHSDFDFDGDVKITD